jgi:hypothetical protein
MLPVPSNRARIVAAGEVFDGEERRYSYNLMRFDLPSGQETIYRRAYSDRDGGFWFSDTLNGSDRYSR